jgi:hypothetical protein
MLRKRARELVFAGLAFVPMAIGARAQSFGDNEQTLTIGAGAFRSRFAAEVAFGADGYLSGSGVAPLDLPDGARIDAVVYQVEATTDVVSGLGAVQILWRRQVSPSPETPSFSDVPETDGAWPQIEALAASGVTAGCGQGLFCPEATLTRRQMAVFLAKALGLHWED